MQSRKNSQLLDKKGKVKWSCKNSLTVAFSWIPSPQGMYTFLSLQMSDLNYYATAQTKGNKLPLKVMLSPASSGELNGCYLSEFAKQ